MNAYITSSGIISPLQTFNAKGFPAQIRETYSNRLICNEPDYRQYINPVQLRRMPRILKMGLASARICLNNSGDIDPDAIIVGTGLGCLESLEKFLLEVLEKNEQVSSVLPFINSTHNAVASQIAMLLKNYGYNYTYCHRAFSFESALQDALLHLKERTANHILVGGIDECTDHYVHLHNYLGRWKKPVRNLDLFADNTSGTLAGEGSAFFLISGSPDNHSNVILKDVSSLFLAGDKAQKSYLVSEAEAFLQKNNVEKSELDLVILGLNGDVQNDSVYQQLRQTYFQSTSSIAAYKHLCGEFYTASAFALWLGTIVIRDQHIPGVAAIHTGHHHEINKILIYNHFNNTEHTFTLLVRL